MATPQRHAGCRFAPDAWLWGGITIFPLSRMSEKRDRQLSMQAPHGAGRGPLTAESGLDGQKPPETPHRALWRSTGGFGRPGGLSAQTYSAEQAEYSLQSLTQPDRHAIRSRRRAPAEQPVATLRKPRPRARPPARPVTPASPATFRKPAAPKSRARGLGRTDQAKDLIEEPAADAAEEEATRRRT